MCTDAEEFKRGEQDCLDGEPHKIGQSEDYDRSYYSEYVAQEIATHRSSGSIH